MKLLALTAVVVGLLVAGCGSTLDHGTVTNKEYRAAYTSVEIVPIMIGERCSTIGKVTSCSPMYSYIPYNVYHPEQFVLDLQACDVHGKCKTGHAYLDKGAWQSVKRGSYWEKHPGDGRPNPSIRTSRA